MEAAVGSLEVYRLNCNEIWIEVFCHKLIAFIINIFIYIFLELFSVFQGSNGSTACIYQKKSGLASRTFPWDSSLQLCIVM
jgi:hypothetical protein